MAILEKDFKQRFEGKLFHRNYHWAGFAVAIWLVGAYATALTLALAEGAIPTPILFAAPALGAAAFLFYRLAKSTESSAGSCIFNILAWAWRSGPLGFTVLTIVTAISTMRWLPIAIAMAGLPLALSSLFWIGAPTKEGRGVLDRIAGFKQYLSITERERLDRMQAPRDTLQMFERWLPYAVALGVENRWADRFSRSSRRRPLPASKASPGMPARTARGRTPAASPIRSDRRCRARSVRPRPRRDRRAGRAAGDRRAAAVAAVAAAAGDQLVAGRR